MKCNEEKPMCARCRRFGHYCVYPIDTTRRRGVQRELLPASDSNAPKPAPKSSSSLASAATLGMLRPSGSKLDAHATSYLEHFRHSIAESLPGIRLSEF